MSRILLSFLTLKFFLPETVQIAQFVDCYRNCPIQLEYSFRRLARRQHLHLNTFVRLKIDELDIMSIKHRMFNIAHYYAYSITVDRNCRNMFFYSSIFCISCEFYLRLAFE